MRYIIIEKDKGIFLGNYLNLPLFSNTIFMPIIQAYSFCSRNDAELYLDYIGKSGQEYTIVSIQYDKGYIPIDILAKEGYTKYTEQMLKLMPAYSNKLH